MSREKDDADHLNIMRNVMGQIKAQSTVYPKPPAHPISPPLNIGTPDPNLKHIDERNK